MAGKGGRRTDQPFCLGHAPEQCSHRLLAGALRQRGGWGLGDFDVVRDSQCQSHIVAAQRVYLQIGGKGVFLAVAQNEAVVWVLSLTRALGVGPIEMVGRYLRFALSEAVVAE